MKILLDVCVSARSLQASLSEWGHDVISVVNIDTRATDDQVLSMALAEDRILITEDKDFGELVFVHGRPHSAIVRLVDLTVPEQIEACRELFENHIDDLSCGSIITIGKSRIRVRRKGT